MDSEPPSRLSGESIISLSYYVSEFLMQAVKVKILLMFSSTHFISYWGLRSWFNKIKLCFLVFLIYVLEVSILVFEIL